jgi:starch synthase
MRRNATRVLFVTPELAPWARVGGLGEVSNDLPRALAAAGVDVRILVPAYPALIEAHPDATCVAEVPALGALAPARLLEARGAVPIYLLDCAACYARAGVYQSPDGADWPDNHLRYGLLSRVAALLGSTETPLAWHPQIVHCHDWQTGLTPAYLAHTMNASAATVMTLHNLAYQGNFPQHVLDELGLPQAAFSIEGLEYYGTVSFLKAGISYATLLTTVSRGYAREIQGPELGFGMDDLLRLRAPDLTGIANGIDPETWDPVRDPHLAQNYGSRVEGKLENKLALQRELGLVQDAEAPLFGMVARLAWHKGMDVMIEAAPAIVAMGAQIAVHGEGSREIGEALCALAERHPAAVAARVGYEERLGHLVTAGADAFLLPSRYEPCGLTQLHCMRYGTLPVAHRTGGLGDSIVDATEDNVRARRATGFTFAPLAPETLIAAAERAVNTYRAREMWRVLQAAAMLRDSSWRLAVPAYLAVYREAIARKFPRRAARAARIPWPAAARAAKPAEKRRRIRT